MGGRGRGGFIKQLVRMQHLFADESLGHGAGIAIAWPWVLKDETLMNRVTRVSTDSAVANEQP